MSNKKIISHEDFTSNKDFQMNRDTLNQILKNRETAQKVNSVEIALFCEKILAPEELAYDGKDGEKKFTTVFKAEFSNQSLGSVQIFVSELVHRDLVVDEWYMCRTKLVTVGDMNKIAVDKFKNATFEKIEFL
jgi:hypothetical protein